MLVLTDCMLLDKIRTYQQRSAKGNKMVQHRKWYAIRATDILGNRRHWADYYRTAKDACKDAKQLRNDHHLGWTIEVLVETVLADGSQIGSNWSHFRAIK